MYTLDELFRGSSHKASVFGREAVEWLESRIAMKAARNGEVPYVKCIVRNKDVRLTPEEAVRQMYVYELIHVYGYSADLIKLEHPVHFGREVKRTDIVIFEKKHPEAAYIIIEVKKPNAKDGKEQLISYCNATGAIIGIWTNGQGIYYYHRKDPNIFETIPRIPKASEKLRDVLTERWTIEDLIKNDKLKDGKKSLKALVQEIEDDVLAMAGVNAFDEIFKLIFTKLYDEMQSVRKPNRELAFRNYGDTDSDLKTNIQALFDEARKAWKGVFDDKPAFALTSSHLALCVSTLQDVKLFNSNLDVVDDAFEFLMNQDMKGVKGQFFTPRYVIDMCVKMLNPQEHETMIDTAAGSCGFPVHTMFYVWGKIYDRLGLQKKDMFTAENKPAECTDYVRDKVFALDFDANAVRVARMLNLIAGDGHTNVLHLNTLDYDMWDQDTQPRAWQKAYSEGWLRFTDHCRADGSYRDFLFDIVMANPPFAGNVKDSRIIHHYDLAKDSKGKYVEKIGRDILFIERNLQFLKPGGRMAIILPQGRFNNSSDKYIRDFISERCRILAVIGLHENVFKPHTGTKTSVLLVQKWDDELCPRVEDYPVFFATMRKPGKDNSGEKVYVKNPDGSVKLDGHNHPIVEHDLYNHEGLTQDGIAEAFVEFAVREGMSFFGGARFDEERYAALMGGLEISEVMLSVILSSGRLDSEYYSKHNRYLQKKLDEIGTRTIAECGGYLDCSAFYPSVADYYNSADANVPFIRVNDINDGVITITDATVFLPEKVLADNRKTMAIAWPGDIVIAKGGTIAKVGLATEEYPYYATSRDVIILRTDKLQGLNRYYLWAFLHSSYGRGILMRSASQTIQPHLTLPAILAIKIPEFTTIEPMIEKMYREAVNMKRESTALYSAAQSLLTSRIGQVPQDHRNTTVRSLSEAFSAGRLDAEYFMPKYDGLLSQLKDSPTVAEACSIHSTNFIPQKDTQYRYIELANIGTYGNITGCITADGQDLPTRARRIVHAGQVIISSIEGSLQSCALITEDYDSALCSTGFYVIDSDTYNPETLLMLFKSETVQTLMKRGCSGTILAAISDDELRKIRLPHVDSDTQTSIAHSLQRSFSLRKKSDSLIRSAVHAVELAVESSEHTAINFISQEVSL